MRNLSIPIALLSLAFTCPDLRSQDSTQYVCPPCGCGECDKKHDEPGKCPACSMGMLRYGSFRNGGPARPSSDGKRIAFWSDRTGDRQLYLMNTDGSEQELLELPHGFLRTPTLSPDGMQLIYAYQAASAKAELFIFERETGKAERVTDNSKTSAMLGSSMPAWSPDGTRIAFASGVGKDSNERRANIFAMNADGSERVNLSAEVAGHHVEPAWSPDGDKLAFVVRVGSERDIYVMDLRSGEATQLRQGEVPNWSPNGKQLTFEITGEGQYHVGIMAADGSDMKQLTQGETMNIHPHWTRDGKSIIFASERDGLAEVWIMNADGSDQRRLTAQASAAAGN